MRAPLFLALLGAFLMTTAAAADTTPAGARLLTDFTPTGADLGWYVVNDGVMGGRSRGGFTSAEEGIDFAGSTNTRGGGFSSIRTRALRWDLGGFDGIRVRVRGDGRRYTWRLTTDARWRGRQVSYWADFETTRGEWTVADIPFSRFKAQWRGRALRDLPLDPRRIRGMGLMIYDKRDGPFALRLERVEAYSQGQPAAPRVATPGVRKRLLVASALIGSNKELQAQLADIRASQAAFAERDMLLVVLLDGAGSRAGDRTLTATEVAAMRKTLGITPGAFALRLVGKDGSVKRAASRPTAMKDLYALIDTMPMRRAEMGR